MHQKSAFVFWFILLGSGSTSYAQWQCPEPEWLPGGGALGTNGIVSSSIMWDPDGFGPTTQRLVIGGKFTLAGDVLTTHIAMYDPASGDWETISAGVGSDYFLDHVADVVVIIRDGAATAAVEVKGIIDIHTGLTER